MVLGGDQLVGRRDPHRLGHAGQAVGVEGLQDLLGADDAHDRAHHPTTDERLATVGLDVADHSGDVRLRCLGSHHDDHGV